MKKKISNFGYEISRISGNFKDNFIAEEVPSKEEALLALGSKVGPRSRRSPSVGRAVAQYRPPVLNTTSPIM